MILCQYLLHQKLIYFKECVARSACCDKNGRMWKVKFVPKKILELIWKR